MMQQPTPHHQMKVSVAIPSMNGERYIADLLRSMAAQTIVPDEIIVSDDGSDDQTREVVEEVSHKTGLSIQWGSHPPAGITQNYLNSLSQTSGEIVLFADQDDVWDPRRVERYVEEFRQHPDTVIISSDSLYVDESLVPLGSTLRGGVARSERLSAAVNQGGDLALFLKGRLPIAAHSLAIRSELREVLLRKPTELEQWWFEDWVMTVSLCFGHLRMIPDALTHYRQHGDQVTRRERNISSGNSPAGEGFRSGRALQLAFCDSFRCAQKMVVIPRAEHERRMNQISRAAVCLRTRDSLAARPLWNRVIPVFCLLFSGAYHAFASGCRSAVKDLLERTVRQ